MNVSKYGRRIRVACTLIALAATGVPARAAEYVVDAGGAWDAPANWSGGLVPSGTDQIVISGSASGKVVTMDSGSWQYVLDNSLLHGSGEYRTQKLLLAASNSATLNVDIGSGRTWKATEGGTYLVGSSSGSMGTLNVLSGSVVLEGSSMKVADQVGSSGLIYVTGADSYFSTARASGDTSMTLGGGGDGTFRIDGGTYESRMGVTVADSGVFEVVGSDVVSIGIGSRSSLDGNWNQAAGGTLKVGVDSGGLTSIFIDDIENDGVGGDVTFASGALLDVGFLAGMERDGSWDVMRWEGVLNDNGLAFAPSVDTAGWSFSWINTDGVGGVDTLRVTYVSEYTTNGTPYSWLNAYYPELSTEEDFEQADESDTDIDGARAWEEFVAGTDPTNAASVFALAPLEIAGDEIIIRWSSVEGKLYGVAASDHLIDSDWLTVASGVMGRSFETAVTSTVSVATNVFYQTYIESMPNLLQLDIESDAYVRSGAFADSNYGSATELKTLNAGADQMETLLRFELPSTTENPDSAYIWINLPGAGTDPVENRACLVEDNSWSEDTVTWNNKPEAGGELDAWVTTNGAAVKIDVTKEVAAALNGGGLFSIMIQSPHDIGTDGQSLYGSRENAETEAPKLVVRFNESKIEVQPGESIQDALDAIHALGGGHVILAAGDHVVSESLEVYSDITLRGQGAGISSILLDPTVNEPILVGTSEGSVNRDITIRDLTLNGQQAADEQHYPIETDRNTVRGDSFGVLFTAQDSGNTFERVRFEDVVITRCAMGIHVKDVVDLRILNSEVRGNGCIIGYDHNIYFRRAYHTLLKNLNISDCTAGNGFNLSTDCNNVILDNCNASDNNFRGIRFEANDGGQRMMIINCTTSRNGLTEGQPGIRVANVPDFTIIGTTSNENGDNGIYCVGSNDGLIRGNTALNNGDSNYNLKNCSNVTAYDNIGW